MAAAWKGEVVGCGGCWLGLLSWGAVAAGCSEGEAAGMRL